MTQQFLDIYLKINEHTNMKRYVHHNVPSSTIYNRQGMEANKCPSTDERIKKM